MLIVLNAYPSISTPRSETTVKHRLHLYYMYNDYDLRHQRKFVYILKVDFFFLSLVQLNMSMFNLLVLKSLSIHLLHEGCQHHSGHLLPCVKWRPPQTKQPTFLPVPSSWKKPRSEEPPWSFSLKVLTISGPVERRHCHCLSPWQETQLHNIVS